MRDRYMVTAPLNHLATNESVKKKSLHFEFTIKCQVTLLLYFHKKGCWILNKSHLSSDANKPF